MSMVWCLRYWFETNCWIHNPLKHKQDFSDIHRYEKSEFKHVQYWITSSCLSLNELIYRYNLPLDVWNLWPLFWPKFCLDHSYTVSSWIYLETSLMALRRHWSPKIISCSTALQPLQGTRFSQVFPSLNFVSAPTPALPAPLFLPLCHNFTSRSDFNPPFP